MVEEIKNTNRNDILTEEGEEDGDDDDLYDENNHNGTALSILGGSITTHTTLRNSGRRDEEISVEDDDESSDSEEDEIMGTGLMGLGGGWSYGTMSTTLPIKETSTASEVLKIKSKEFKSSPLNVTPDDKRPNKAKEKSQNESEFHSISSSLHEPDPKLNVDLDGDESNEQDEEIDDEYGIALDRHFLSIIQEMKLTQLETEALRLSLRANDSVTSALELYRGNHDKEDFKDTLKRIARRTIIDIAEGNIDIEDDSGS